jgi:hypothetical protein
VNCAEAVLDRVGEVEPEIPEERAEPDRGFPRKVLVADEDPVRVFRSQEVDLVVEQHSEQRVDLDSPGYRDRGVECLGDGPGPRSTAEVDRRQHVVDPGRTGAAGSGDENGCSANHLGPDPEPWR